jgi:holo-[acyl-carrier protein] synthase
VLNNEDGQPYVQVNGEAQSWLRAMEIKKVYVSITHTKQYAAAVVILEK